MQLSEFKEQLEKIGVSYDLVKQRRDEHAEEWGLKPRLEGIVSTAYDFKEVIRTAFYWIDTPEGFDYWSNVHNGASVQATKDTLDEKIDTAIEILQSVSDNIKKLLRGFKWKK